MDADSDSLVHACEADIEIVSKNGRMSLSAASTGLPAARNRLTCAVLYSPAELVLTGPEIIDIANMEVGIAIYGVNGKQVVQQPSVDHGEGGRDTASVVEDRSIRALLTAADIPVTEIAASVGVARSTLYHTVLNPA